MTTHSQTLPIFWDGREVEIEYTWVNRPSGGPGRGPVMVFLHEGLGSVAMWKQFPQALCEACGLPGLVYSRPGYGRSTPRPADEHWHSDFMHRQAYEVLPSVLDALHITQPVVLFGHSDGGSIALLFTARHPERVAAAVVAAPHLFVEAIAISSIEEAKQAYLRGGLRDKLAPYHLNPDSAFWGWNDVWLSSVFRAWNIEAEVRTIERPVLAIQGEQDAYGTMRQIRRIGELTARTQLLELPDCGHSPHRDQMGLLTSAVTSFLQQHLGDLA